MNKEQIIERAAREAYAAWRDHFGSDANWGWISLSPIARAAWLNIAHAAIAEATRHDKGSSHE